MTEAIRSHGTHLQMGDGGSAGTPLTGVTSAADAYATLLTFAAAHGLVDGQPVTVSGLTGTGATVANGTWAVKKVTSKVVSIPVATTGAGTGGTVTPQDESFTTVAKVGDIQGPAYTRDNVDVTSHDSPLDYEELLATIKKSGELTFSLFWLPTDPTHDATTGLFAAYEDGITRNWKLVLTDFESDPTELHLTGYVSGFAPKAPVAGVLAADLKVQVTGASYLIEHSS